LSIRLELSMRVKTGRVVVTRPLSVYFTANYEPLAPEKCYPGYSLSYVPAAPHAHIRRILQASCGQAPLTCQRKTIQYP